MGLLVWMDKVQVHYSETLDSNLHTLLDRAKVINIKVQPARRAYTRATETDAPIGIPAFEDKILQRAVADADGADI